MKFDEMILGKDVKVSTNCDETQCNNNVIVCGSSGCGKTMSIIEPKLLCTYNSSLVVTLSKKRIIPGYTELFKERGYKVINLDFANPAESESTYDPIQYIRSFTDITYLSTSIVMADVRKKESKADPYWDSVAISLLSAFISLSLIDNPHTTMADVVGLFRRFNIYNPEGTGLMETNMDLAFDSLRKTDPNHFAVSCWDSFRQTPIRTAGCIYSTLSTMLDNIFTSDLCTMLKKSKKISFEEITNEKTVVFVTTSAVNPALHTFVNMFYSQMFKELFEIGERNESGKLNIPIQIVCDDFACGAKILNFEEYISIFREKGISVTMMLQSESQLQGIYGEYEAKTIINNSDTYIYMGGIDLSTAKNISERMNMPLEDVLYMPIGQEFIFRRGTKPVITTRYEITEDKEYKKMKRLEKKKNKESIKNNKMDIRKLKNEDKSIDELLENILASI